MDRILLEQIRMARFDSVHSDYKSKKINQIEAARILGCSERHFRRLLHKFDEGGLEALSDRRVGRRSNLSAADAEVEELTKLYAEKFSTYNVRHFHETAKRDYGIKRSYTWVRNTLVSAKLVDLCGKGGKHRLRRARRPQPGMMLHQDASKHLWFGDGRVRSRHHARRCRQRDHEWFFLRRRRHNEHLPRTARNH
jgi:transposase